MEAGGRSDAATLHGNHADDRFESGARRIGAADGTVDKGLHRVVLQLLVMFATFATHKKVGVVSGAGDKGQNLSCGRLDGHDGADFAHHQLLAVGLQVGIHT